MTAKTQDKSTIYGSLSTKPSYMDNEEPDSQRWRMLFILSLMSGLNQSICYSYAPIATSAERKWNGKLHSTTLITIFFVSYVPFSFYGSWILDKYGLRKGLILGGMLQAVGTWLRVLSNYTSQSFEIPLVLFGQFLASLAMPFAVNSPPLLSAIWFPTQERAMATGVSVNANSLGISFVYFAAPFFVLKDGDITTWEINIAFISTVAVVFTILFFKHSPNVNTNAGNPSEGYDWHQWVNIFSLPGFTSTVICFSVSECVLNAFSSLLNIFLLPEGFSKHQIGTIGGFFIISAICGSSLICSQVGQKIMHISALKICLSGSLIFLVAFKLSLDFYVKTVTFFSLMALGAFIGPLQSVVLELGVKCTHRTTSETTVAGVQQLCGNFLSAIWIPIMSLLHRQFKNTYGHVDGSHFYACPEWIMFVMLALTLLMFILR